LDEVIEHILDEVKMKFKKIENNNLEWMEYSNYG
jgi:hypothetical protein